MKFAFRTVFLLAGFLIYTNIDAITVTSVANGDWNTAATWDCGCVPATDDNVIVDHDVTFAAQIDIDPGGSIIVNAGASLIGTDYIDFNGDSAGPIVAVEVHGYMEATGMRAEENCGLASLDVYGSILITGGAPISNDLEWRADGTFTIHQGGTVDIPTGIYRTSNQVLASDCPGGNPRTVIAGTMSSCTMEYHANSILDITPTGIMHGLSGGLCDPIFMAAYEANIYGCICAESGFNFTAKANNSGHNESTWFDGSSLVATIITIDHVDVTILGVNDDVDTTNNACLYSEAEISTNAGAFSGEMFLNDPDGAVPGTVGGSVVLGTDQCGSTPAEFCPCGNCPEPNCFEINVSN